MSDDERTPRDAGGTAAGVLITLLVIAVIAVGAFFYFGGRADVDVESPNVDVSAEPDPPSVDPTADVDVDATTDG